MGTIKTTNIEPIADNGTVTLGSSGDTFTLGSGVVQSNMLYPAFEARLSAFQNLSNDTDTKVQFDTEVFDTDNTFDNSTNYRFTVPSGGAGKYLINGAITLRANATSISTVYAYLYKNGSGVNLSMANFTNSLVFITTQNFSVLIDLVAGDYLELFGYVDGSGTTAFDPGVSSDTVKSTYLAGYRIGA